MIIKTGKIAFFLISNRKNLSHILGTQQEMKEISSRFSKQSGSDEIVTLEGECECSFAHDVHQQPMDGDIDDFDDDEYVPSMHQTKKPPQRAIPNEHKQATRTATDYLPLSSTSGKGVLLILALKQFHSKVI